MNKSHPEIYQATKVFKLVVFVGGQGGRMWPMSRRLLPKQFQALVGERTMFQQMMDHLLSAYQPEDLFVSTSERYVELIKSQVPHLLADQFILEPEVRDTTAAVGLAATHIAQRYPNSLMATLWGGDHLIRQRDQFLQALALARRVAEEYNLTVQINVRPTYPSPSLGYVEIGGPMLTDLGPNIYTFKRQVEKPDMATARQFLASTAYLWHTGYRVWHVETLLELYRRYVPDSYAALIKIQQALGTADQGEVIKREYAKIEKKAIDYTIFEHVGSDGQAVVAADLGWNDVGTWQVLKDELSDTDQQNIVQGQTVLLDTTDSLVYSSANKLVAVLGMDSVVVVDTPDALLVMPKGKSSEVKRLIEKFKEEGLDKFL